MGTFCNGTLNQTNYRWMNHRNLDTRIQDLTGQNNKVELCEEANKLETYHLFKPVRREQ